MIEKIKRIIKWIPFESSDDRESTIRDIELLLQTAKQSGYAEGYKKGASDCAYSFLEKAKYNNTIAYDNPHWEITHDDFRELQQKYVGETK